MARRYRSGARRAPSGSCASTQPVTSPPAASGPSPTLYIGDDFGTSFTNPTFNLNGYRGNSQVGPTAPRPASASSPQSWAAVATHNPGPASPAIRTQQPPSNVATNSASAAETTPEVPDYSGPTVLVDFVSDPETDYEEEIRMSRRKNKSKGPNGNRKTPQPTKGGQPKGNSFAQPKKSGPVQPQATAPPTKDVRTGLIARARRGVVPMPWEIDPEYVGVKSSHNDSLVFNYRECAWKTLGNTALEILEKLAQELTRKRRAVLPPLYKDMTQDDLIRAQMDYAKPYQILGQRRNELDLFEQRLKTRLGRQTTRLIFVSPMVRLAELGYTMNSDRGLIRVMGIPELATFILENLMPSLRSIASLAASCRELALLVSANMETWNSTTGDFITDNTNNGVRSNILTIASMAIEQQRTASPYSDSFSVLRKFAQTVSDASFSFRDVIIDQLPFFDTRVFETMLRSMPNLRTVAISRCLLLDASKLPVLLRAVQMHSRSMNDEEVRYVKLDFAPYFFDGPNQKNRRGSFGVTYHEPSFNVPKAIACLLLNNRKLAKEVGMDLFSESSSFWHFVRRLPGPDPLWAYKVRESIMAYDAASEAIWLAPGNQYHGIRIKQIHDRFADDITAATSGDNMEPARVPDRAPVPRRGEYWREEESCRMCGYDLFRSFFNICEQVCWACRMSQYVEVMEDSHLRHRQLSILNDLFHDPNNTIRTFKDLLNLGDEVRESALNLSIMGAVDLDRVWAYHMLHEVGPERWAVDHSKPEPKMAFPEPRNADQAAASVRRIQWSRGHYIPPQDLREGGPQYEHPCREEPSSLVTMILTEHGTESFADFQKKWSPTAETKFRMAGAYTITTGTTENPTAYLRDLLSKRSEVRMACWLDWVEQNLQDANTWVREHARCMDAMFSGIGPGRRSWNRDKFREVKNEAGLEFEGGFYRNGVIH